MCDVWLPLWVCSGDRTKVEFSFIYAFLWCEGGGQETNPDVCKIPNNTNQASRSLFKPTVQRSEDQIPLSWVFQNDVTQVIVLCDTFLSWRLLQSCVLAATISLLIAKFFSWLKHLFTGLFMLCSFCNKTRLSSSLKSIAFSEQTLKYLDMLPSTHSET